MEYWKTGKMGRLGKGGCVRGVVRKALFGKEAFEQRPERSKERSQAGILEKEIPGLNDREIKGPQGGLCVSI